MNYDLREDRAFCLDCHPTQQVRVCALEGHATRRHTDWGRQRSVQVSSSFKQFPYAVTQCQSIQQCPPLLHHPRCLRTALPPQLDGMDDDAGSGSDMHHHHNSSGSLEGDVPFCSPPAATHRMVWGGGSSGISTCGGSGAGLFAAASGGGGAGLSAEQARNSSVLRACNRAAAAAAAADGGSAGCVAALASMGGLLQQHATQQTPFFSHSGGGAAASGGGQSGGGGSGPAPATAAFRAVLGQWDLNAGSPAGRFEIAVGGQGKPTPSVLPFTAGF
jgi:hypothetical protein